MIDEAKIKPRKNQRNKTDVIRSLADKVPHYRHSSTTRLAYGERCAPERCAAIREADVAARVDVVADVDRAVDAALGETGLNQLCEAR